MKTTLICSVLTASSVFAQPEVKTFNLPLPPPMAIGAFTGGPSAVPGAPYTANIVNESIQTLADGNRIVQRSTGSTARDSQGRTRQDMALPDIANLAAANAPHLVFIQDPVAQTGYSLNLTDKTAHKLPGPGLSPGVPAGGVAKFGIVTAQAVTGGITSAPMLAQGAIMATGGTFIGKDAAPVKTENLGSRDMEGVAAQGVRTTRSIPAGEIGNDKPIEIVTEIWTSPELKTIVYSKRSDPRIGEQTFSLTNVVRSEPDPALFTVPADFKIVDGSEPGQDVIFYRRKQ